MPGSILNFVPVNFDPETGAERELWCFSIAAKRYCLFTFEPDGSVRIAVEGSARHRSEHGLGHLLPPVPTANDAAPVDWVSDWWEHLISLDLDLPTTRPWWFDQPAVSPLTITSAQDERAFARFNEGRPYATQTRPWGFAMIAHVHPFARSLGSPTALVAARDDSAARLSGLDWFDRSDPTRSPLAIGTGDSMWHVEGAVTVQSFDDYFDTFRMHTEGKAAGSDGEPCTSWTRGQLQPLQVEVTSLVRIGKEASRLIEGSGSLDAASFRAEEYRPSTCDRCGKTVWRGRRWCSDACRKRYERDAQRGPRRCGWCRRELRSGQRKWCSDVCRKRADRRRTSTP